MSSTNDSNRWAGDRLGLPAEGSRSIAKMPARIFALCIDWAVASIISYGYFKYDSYSTLVIFALEQVLLLGTAQASIGHRLLGLRLIKLDKSAVNLLDALIRTILLVLVIPATIWDADNRALHDKAAKTVLVVR